MNSWKQPTPTDIRSNKSIDILARLLFLDILNGCQNKPYHKTYWHGNKRIDLELQRGQYLFNVSMYQRALKLPRRRIEKSLKTINNWYTELQIERMPFGLIITVKGYDELTKMQNEMPNETQNERKTNAKRTQNEVKSKNKNDKSVKNEKSEKNINNRGDTRKKIRGMEACKKYIEVFNKLFGTSYRPTETRAKKLLARLRVYTLEEVAIALYALGQSKWHRGENPSGWRATPDFLIRNNETLDEWLQKGKEIKENARNAHN